MSDLDFSVLESAVQKQAETGLTACQVAVGHEGEIVFARSLGSADDTTRFWIASATKPIVSAAVLQLIGDGALDVAEPVARYIPEFAANGKDRVTVEQVMLMTAGFPDAPMSSREGADPARRIARMTQWELQSKPGTHYAYHAMSAHWVLAELIERISGTPFCDFVEERITRPLGIPRLLGIPESEQRGLAQTSAAADDVTRNEYDYAAKIACGEPGGGALARAVDLARFYQGLLHNPDQLWEPAVLADALRNVRNTLPDPMMKMPANRTLAVMVGNGFGGTWGSSATAFGWPGAGGQIAFAEPATGISFAFFQMGDTDQVSQFVRGIQLSALALELTP